MCKMSYEQILHSDIQNYYMSGSVYLYIKQPKLKFKPHRKISCYSK